MMHRHERGGFGTCKQRSSCDSGLHITAYASQMLQASIGLCQALHKNVACAVKSVAQSGGHCSHLKRSVYIVPSCEAAADTFDIMNISNLHC